MKLQPIGHVTTDDGTAANTCVPQSRSRETDVMLKLIINAKKRRLKDVLPVRRFAGGSARGLMPFNFTSCCVFSLSPL